MIISKDTHLCASIAENPGNFGTTLFNAAFRHAGLNFVYKAFRVEKKDLKKAIEGIRVLGIRGCGVSMPHKKNAMKYLDKVDAKAQKIGAVNTIVNDHGKLEGYNTDYFGALRVLPDMKGRKVLMRGAGGVAEAIAAALKEKKPKAVFITNRSSVKGRKFAKKWNFQYIDKSIIKADVFINATPIGMTSTTKSLPLKKAEIDNFDIIMDVVQKPLETKLIKLAKSENKKAIPGWQMSLWQAIKQFELYTGKKPPLKIMKESIKKLRN